MKHQAKKQTRSQHMPVVIVCILILVLAVMGLGMHFIKKYIPTKERMNLTEYYGQPGDGEMAVVLGTEIMEERALMSGDQIYLPLDMVNTYLNQRYYWDSADQQVLYATPSELQYYPAAESGEGDVWLKDGTVYLRLGFVQKFTDLDAYVYENPNRVAIQYRFTGVQTTTVKKDTSIRYQGGIKSPILTDVKTGDTLIFLEELEDWAQVATMDGYIGYVQKDTIASAETKDFERSFEKEEYTYLTMDGKVNMSWHQVTSQDANAYLADTIANVSGVNVISPTWYYIQDTAGNIGNIASADYVALAHERGLKVWGLIDNFTAEVSTTDTLSQNNLVLSVDNPVPEDFTSHYDRREQGLVVDYIVIMGYDEHYVGSDAGSVASLPWVEQGVQDTIAEAPAERTVLAIPFYTRLWKTTGGALTSEAIGMDEAQNDLTENGVEAVWDGSVSQNYATFEKDNSTYQIWLEDAQSIAEKVKLIPKYNLAGVAQWKLGFENSSIWQTISDNLQ